MVMDNRFYYDETGYLRAHSEDPDNTLVTDLFHGLSHAKKEIALVVKDNLELFDRLLGVLQKKPEPHMYGRGRPSQ